MRRARPSIVIGLVLGLLALAPATSEAASTAADPSPARIETFDLPSSLVDPAVPGGRLEKRRSAPRVHVQLPAGYDDHPNRDYPVLWLLHGANGGTDTWLPGITTLLDGIEAILVMPDGGEFGMYMDWWRGGQRGGPAWTTFHLTTLKDTIEERYRIRPARRWHAIAGISMGGQGALRYAALLPGYFGSVAAFSAALPDMQAPEAVVGLSLIAAIQGESGVSYDAIWGDPNGPYAAGNSAHALAPNLAHTRLYLTAGNGVHCLQDRIRLEALPVDTVTEAVLHSQLPRFSAKLRSLGAEVTTRSTCGSHTFGVWDRAIPAAHRWGFFAPVVERPTRWTYRTIRQDGEAWGFRYRFDRPPAQVVDLVRDGTVLSASGSGRLALAGPNGCRIDQPLPFRIELPKACR